MIPLSSTGDVAAPMLSGAISQRINAERIVLFGWSRAILLQLAHPLVAAGVADHSSFRRGAFSAAARLHQTVRAMLALVFADEPGRAATVARIRGIHRRVNGRLSEAAGPFAAGTGYSAEDPALVLWVHVTLLDSIPLVYERLVGPLTGAERDRYCAEAASIALDLGARRDEVPRTWKAMEHVVDCTYASGAITVSGQARELAAQVLSPPFAPFVAPVAALNRLITVGLLPERVRRQYGLEWTTGHERRLQYVVAAVRCSRRLLPQRLAWWPEARHRPRPR